jgi:carbon monoxide dehydrogenase subunit G
MSKVTTNIEIAAPIEKVWETVMNPDCLGDWVTIHRDVSSVSDRPLVEGSTMEQVLHMRGFSFRVNWKLVDVTAPHTAHWEGRGPAHSRALIRYELESSGDGRTQFHYTNDFQPPGGRLGNVASRFIVGAASEREASNSLSRLKSLLERD